MNLGGMLKIVQGWVKIKGDTDGTKIGNVGDELKVHSSIQPGSVACLTTSLKYIDMNASVGGVARGTNIGTTFVDVYSGSGAGVILGFLVTMENGESNWRIRLEVDSIEVFDVDVEDFEDDQVYNYKVGNLNTLTRSLGFNYRNKTLFWEAPSQFPLCFTSTVVVQARRTSGNKKFRAGLISLTGV